MYNCYSCGVPFDETNNSLEHIINNGIGGRWRSKWLLCKACNEEFGSTIDQVLNSQLGVLVDHLGVNRQREKDHVFIALKAADGSAKMVEKQLKPMARIITRLPGQEPVVEYVPEEEFEKKIAKKKRQVTKKYKIASEAYYTELPSAELHRLQNSMSDDKVDFGIGGQESFRSMTKMAVNFYLLLKNDIEWVKPAISMIRGEVANEMTFFYYPNPNHHTIHDLGDDEVSHIIHIRGIAERKLLYAYVELFNMQNVLIRLNMDYHGPDINETYAFDILSGKRIDKQIVIKLTKPHFGILELITPNNRTEIDKRYRRLELIIEKNQLGRWQKQ